jgi:nitroimidazol reductase NimA-like FMN-containing flavoprotein (pyridoxamine 5'-phosphate oxidase superfamily)
VTDLTDAECHEMLARNRLCVLSLVDGDSPYAIQLFYGYDGEGLYFGISEGTKTGIMETNARVCANVTEVGDGDTWSSVLVFGEARWIREPGDRESAIRILTSHNRKFRDPSTAEGVGDQQPRRAAHGPGRLFVVSARRVTGKAKR